MKNLPLNTILGVALVAGSVTVSIVLIMLIWSYTSSGQLSPLNSVIAIIAALLLLALPQLGLGVYLIWHDRRETAVINSNENRPE